MDGMPDNVSGGGAWEVEWEQREGERERGGGGVET